MLNKNMKMKNILIFLIITLIIIIIIWFLQKNNMKEGYTSDFLNIDTNSAFYNYFYEDD